MIHVQLSTSPFDAHQAFAFVHSVHCGAIDTFIGTVRQQTNGRTVQHLEYEAYEPMAQQQMYALCQEAQERWSVHALYLQHRVGIVLPGEIAVVAAVSALHRREAFAACHFIIDTLKRCVPIWKKEVFDDGELWVMPNT
ncbi:MAG: molybdenum cofactor biosynthesis protein MoaE [Bacteroidota bacterium]|nr:molybdenum cofactor biosynthesis protein MoaE [Candidatus Kapabacteria bacterium]MDW8221187.1 molybdenum cofactor biosynthesis protein MoaE [Bacteroidota bacterium]